MFSFPEIYHLCKLPLGMVEKMVPIYQLFIEKWACDKKYAMLKNTVLLKGKFWK